MTERLYQADSRRLCFQATVIETRDAGAGRWGVILDRTAFYPDSGGQPCDTGFLAGHPVHEVGEDDQERVCHILDAPLAVGAAVAGEVDADRRFDHMQQHSGQHILSAAFWRLGNFKTVGFHLGAEASTIDLHPPTVSAEQVDAAVESANRVIWENREVSAVVHEKAEAEKIGLRKPTAREGAIRVVSVADWDRSACGGTHVSRTGEVGGVALVRTEKLKDKLRIHFLCGERAFRRFREEHRILAELCVLTTTGGPELPDRVRSLQTDLKAAQREVGVLKTELLRAGIPALLAGAERFAGVAVVGRALDEASAPAQALCRALLETGTPTVAVIGSSRDGTLFFGRSPEIVLDMTALAAHLRQHFSARGGGRPDLAQVGGLEPERLPDVLSTGLAWLREALAAH